MPNSRNRLGLLIVMLCSSAPVTSMADMDVQLREQMSEIDSISVSIDQAFTDHEGSPIGFSLPIHAQTMAVLSHWGIDIVSPDMSPNATLNIELRGAALAARYAPPGSGYAILRFVGAEITGRTTLSVGDDQIFASGFEAQHKPPSHLSISEGSDKPTDAPFLTVYESSEFRTQLLDLTAHKVGLRSLVLASAELDSIAHPDLVLDLVNAETNPEGVIVDLLGDERQEVLDSAMSILEIKSSGSEAVAEALMLLTGHTSDGIKIKAVDLLGILGYSSAVEVLIDLLKYSTEDVRRSAAVALGRIRSEQAIQPLLETIASTINPTITDPAMVALEKITKRGFGRDEEKWIEWWESSTGMKIEKYTNPQEQSNFWFALILVAVGLVWLGWPRGTRSP